MGDFIEENMKGTFYLMGFLMAFVINKAKIIVDFVIHILYNDFHKMKGQYMTNEQKPKSWIDYLSEEELAFVKRFVLASGSLKEIARVYGVSYPTVRLSNLMKIIRLQLIPTVETVVEVI